MPQQAIRPLTPLPLTQRIHLLVALVAPIARRPRTRRVVAAVDLRIGIAQLDRDVPLQLVLEPHRLHARDGLHDGALAVRDMADGADVDRGLPADDLGGERGQAGDVEIGGVGLVGEAGARGFEGGGGVGLLQRGLRHGRGASCRPLLDVLVGLRLDAGRRGRGLVVGGEVAVGRHDCGWRRRLFSVWSPRCLRLGSPPALLVLCFLRGEGLWNAWLVRLVTVVQ